MEKYGESLEDFSEALSRDPNDGNIYFNRGNTYLAMKRHEDALNDFNKAINKVETDENYFHCKGMAYEEMKRMQVDLYSALTTIEIEKAIEMFKKALEVNAQFVPSLYHLGLMYHASSQLFEAKKCFSKVLKYVIMACIMPAESNKIGEYLRAEDSFIKICCIMIWQ